MATCSTVLTDGGITTSCGYSCNAGSELCTINGVDSCVDPGSAYGSDPNNCGR